MTSWSFDPILNSYALVLMVTVALGLCLWVHPFRALNAPRRRTLRLLRGAVLLLVVLAMLRPTRTSTSAQPQTAVFIVLFDQSRSMQLPQAASEESRWAALTTTLRQIEPPLTALAEKLEIKVYPFADGLGPPAWQDRQLQLPADADGAITDIGSSLYAAIHQELGKRLVGVVLLSDGTQTAFHPEHEIYEAARELGNLGYPLYTVAFGPPGDVTQSRDVAVENLPDHDTVFVKNQLVVRGLVRVRGYVNKEIPLELVVEDAAGKRQTIGPVAVQATRDNEALNVELTYVPQEPGQYRLTLHAPPLAGELVTKNNQLSAFLTVLEGGLKVLYLEGEPRQEQKFIRWALDRSPDIDLDFQWFPSRLRDRWPVALRSLLEQEDFDVFMIGDCDSAIFGAEQLEILATQVERGKGLIALGGYHAFGPGGYYETRLRDVLPIEMERFARQEFDRPEETRWHIPGPLPMIPTGEHPITLLAAPEDNLSVWRELKPLTGANRWPGVKRAPGVQVLAGTPDDVPLLVAGAYGQGRVLAFAGDSTWQWWRQGLQARHKRFWRQVILWLARRDDLTRQDVWIDLDQRRFTVGSQVVFSAGARSASGDVLRSATLNATFTDAGNTTHPVRLVQDGDQYRGTIDQVTLPGDGRIEVTATGPSGSLVGTATARIEVVDQDAELSQPVADHDQLARLAQFTRDAGGRPVAREQLANLLDEIRQNPPELVQEVLTRWQLGDTAWDGWLLLLALVGLLGSEWFLRKRWGLV